MPGGTSTISRRTKPTSSASNTSGSGQRFRSASTNVVFPLPNGPFTQTITDPRLVTLSGAS